MACSLLSSFALCIPCRNNLRFPSGWDVLFLRGKGSYIPFCVRLMRISRSPLQRKSCFTPFATSAFPSVDFPFLAQTSHKQMKAAASASAYPAFSLASCTSFPRNFDHNRRQTVSNLDTKCFLFAGASCRLSFALVFSLERVLHFLEIALDVHPKEPPRPLPHDLVGGRLAAVIACLLLSPRPPLMQWHNNY